MSENKATKDKKDEIIEAEKEAEITADIKEVTENVTPATPVLPKDDRKNFGGSGNRKPRQGGGRFGDREKEPKEFEEKVIAVDRVTRVVKGGRRMRFRALVVIGDKKGRVGYGSGKGNEVTTAVSKGVNKAKKNLFKVPIINGTVPHDIIGRSRSTNVLIKKAKKDRGIIAGGAVRIVLELAGYSDIVSKSHGSNNKTNNVIATINALNSLIVTKKDNSKQQVSKDSKEKKEEVAK